MNDGGILWRLYLGTGLVLGMVAIVVWIIGAALNSEVCAWICLGLMATMAGLIVLTAWDVRNGVR